MRLRFSLVALAALASTACSSASGGRATYDSGAGSQARSAPSRAAPAPAPSYAASRSGNTAYVIMTSGCHYCQKLRSNTLTDGSVRAELSSLNGQQVDADTSAGRAIANQYRVSGYPTTVVVSPSGAVVKKIVGYYAPGDYVGQLRQAH